MQIPDKSEQPAGDPGVVPGAHPPAGDEVVQVGSSPIDGLAPLHTAPELLSGREVSPEQDMMDFVVAASVMCASVLEYEKSLWAHGLDVSAPAVQDAGSHINRSTVRLAIAHTRLTGTDFPGPVGDAVDASGDYSFDDDPDTGGDFHLDEWDEEPEDVHVPEVAPANELPVFLAANILLADGPWGAIALRGYLVYSSGVKIELDWILRQSGATNDDWQDAWLTFQWTAYGDESDSYPVTVPAGFTAHESGGGAYAVAEFSSGQKAIWVTPLPSDTDLDVTIALPSLGLDALAITVPAGLVRDAAASVITVDVAPPDNTSS